MLSNKWTHVDSEWLQQNQKTKKSEHQYLFSKAGSSRLCSPNCESRARLETSIVMAICTFGCPARKRVELKVFNLFSGFRHFFKGYIWQCSNQKSGNESWCTCHNSDRRWEVELLVFTQDDAKNASQATNAGAKAKAHYPAKKCIFSQQHVQVGKSFCKSYLVPLGKSSMVKSHIRSSAAVSKKLVMCMT